MAVIVAVLSAIGLGLGGLFLAGCSNQVASVAKLDAQEELRDEIARIEAAIAIRSSEMQALATECASCQNALSTVTSAASERLNAAGGLWEPWTTDNSTTAELSAYQVSVNDGVATFTDASGNTASVQIPDEVGDAPYTVRALAAYMYRSADEQLAQLVETEVDAEESEQFNTLAALLAGRMVSALELADAYGVNLEAAIAELPAAVTSATAVDSQEASQDSRDGEQDETEVATATVSTWELPDTESLELSEDARSELSEALRQFDCLAGAMTAAISSGADEDAATTYRVDSVSRTDQLLAYGAVESRDLRCESASSETDVLYAQAVAVDLQLLASKTVEVRQLGAIYLLEDIATWVENGEANQVSPGI